MIYDILCWHYKECVVLTKRVWKQFNIFFDWTNEELNVWLDWEISWTTSLWIWKAIHKSMITLNGTACNTFSVLLVFLWKWQLLVVQYQKQPPIFQPWKYIKTKNKETRKTLFLIMILRTHHIFINCKTQMIGI
jgi:hypothetical protein